MSSEDGEVIFFKSPSTESTVFVTNLHPDVTNEELAEVFSSCGLICDLHQFQPNESQYTNGRFCAFVKYYTQKSAQRANFELVGCKFHGVPCKVTIAKREGANSSTFANRELPLSKSIELLNYYYGFDKWSTRVVAMRQVQLQKEAEGDMTACEYQCEVLLTLKDGRKVRGTGQGKYSGKDIPMVLENTQKFAVTNARKNAFQKLAIVVLASGKAAVHALDEEKDTSEAKQEKDELDLYNPHPNYE